MRDGEMGAGAGLRVPGPGLGERYNPVPGFMNASLFERFTERRASCLSHGEDNLRATSLSMKSTGQLTEFLIMYTRLL